MHNTNNQQIYLYRAGDFWYVNNELGQETGCLKANVVTEEDKRMPPVKGWTYYDGSKYQSDPTLVWSREVTPACSKIIVELQGAAKEIHPDCAGSYLPVEGKINRGRWVLQHASGIERYLTVRTGQMGWTIGPDIDEDRGWIASGGLGVRDDVKSWEYADNGWKEGVINVKCTIPFHTFYTCD